MVDKRTKGKEERMCVYVCSSLNFIDHFKVIIISKLLGIFSTLIYASNFENFAHSKYNGPLYNAQNKQLITFAKQCTVHSSFSPTILSKVHV